jgi:hypothetical protein
MLERGRHRYGLKRPYVSAPYLEPPKFVFYVVRGDVFPVNAGGFTKKAINLPENCQTMPTYGVNVLRAVRRGRHVAERCVQSRHAVTDTGHFIRILISPNTWAIKTIGPNLIT